MAIRVAGQDIEDLPAQQVLCINSGISRGILQQLVAVSKGRAAGILVFFFVPVPQGLAEVLLVQTLYFTAFIPYAIIALNLRIETIFNGMQFNIDYGQFDLFGQITDKCFIGRQMTIVC